jgi:hypothetical protein
MLMSTIKDPCSSAFRIYNSREGEARSMPRKYFRKQFLLKQTTVWNVFYKAKYACWHADFFQQPCKIPVTMKTTHKYLNVNENYYPLGSGMNAVIVVYNG